MKVFHRRRFLIWLIRAYIKKWGKIFLLGFLVGVVLFILLKENSPKVLSLIQIREPFRVGIVGAYTLDSLPQQIQEYISMGLTKIDENGKVIPQAAESWQVENDGKTYIFHLRRDLVFQDGKKFTSKDVNYNFKEAKIYSPDPYIVQFELEDPFAPMPAVLSRPLFKKGLVGLSDFKVLDFEKNGDFVKSLTLQSKKELSTQLVFNFYPTEQAVKTAFMLGEIDQIYISDPSEFDNWNLTLEKNVDTKKLVVLFYNTRDPNLSKQIRQGLSYALPQDNFQEIGVWANSPLAGNSWAFKEQPEKFRRNIENAKRLLETEDNASDSAKLAYTLITPPRFKEVAEKIKEAFLEVGVSIEIVVATDKPSDFQMFLDQITIPDDPDQYTLWHSTGATNITHYASPRIDKLLEDGRKTIDDGQRKEIYGELQKYLVDEAPASFLYYPYVYTIKRK